MERFTVGLHRLKLLSNGYSLEKSIDQAMPDEVAAIIVSSSSTTNCCTFVKRHLPSKSERKTDKPRPTNFKCPANFKSSANSRSPYTCYCCGHTGHKRNDLSFPIVFAINGHKKEHIASVCNSSKKSA